MTDHRIRAFYLFLLLPLLALASNTGTPGAQPSAAPAPTVLAGNGEPGFRDGSGEQARFNKPIRLAPFGADAIVVADISNHAVRIVDQEGTVSTIAGGPEQKGWSDGPADTAQFSDPHGVAVSAGGVIAVAGASSHSVRLITPTGGSGQPAPYLVTTAAGVPGSSGMQDGPTSQAQFNSPHGVAWEADGGLLVVDIGNASIRRVSDGTVSTVHKAGDGGMAMPIDISLTEGSGLLVADASTNRILRASAGDSLQVVPMNGELAVPHGVTADPDGNVYVAEIRGHRVVKITPDGEIVTVAGDGQEGSGPGQLNKPAAVLVHAGLLWIADLGNHRIVTLPLAP